MAIANIIYMTYSKRDAATAALVASELSQLGLRIIDPQSAKPDGSQWREHVLDAARRSSALVAVIGNSGAESSGWLAYEVGLFDAQSKPIFILLSHNIPASSLPFDLWHHRIVTFDPAAPQAAAREILVRQATAA